MRDMEERGVGKEGESDVILVSEGIDCVWCVRERARACVFSHSIDSFFTEFKSNRVLK